jgi:hypothetical protein
MKTYNVKIDVLLEPIGAPDLVITCRQETKELIISEPTWINFEFSTSQTDCDLSIEHRNKHPYDSTTAVIVKSVLLNNINSIQNTYQGLYYPINRPAVRDTYLSWNGIWILSFTVPVFTWIHKVENLGWIYD